MCATLPQLLGKHILGCIGDRNIYSIENIREDLHPFNVEANEIRVRKQKYKTSILPWARSRTSAAFLLAMNFIFEHWLFFSVY